MQTFEALFVLIDWLNVRDVDFRARAEPPGDIRLSFNMNDYFYWGCGDDEDVSIEDLPLLQECEADLKATGEEYADIYIPSLFACRKRKMAPQGACLKNKSPKVKELLIACGPREIDLCNPYTPDGVYSYKNDA